MKHLLCAITCAATLMLVAACSKESPLDESRTHYRYDVVTYTGSDATTGCATFELVGRDVAPSVTLRGNVKADSTMKVLQRVLLRYDFARDDEASSVRDIKMYGVTRIITDSLRFATVPLSRYAMHPVKMRSAWRTGDFINLHCMVEHTGKARRFMLLIDDATRNQDTVHCYLHHDLLADTAYFWRECYASFNVGNVWKRTECKTMRVHINDEDLGAKCYDFDRK